MGKFLKFILIVLAAVAVVLTLWTLFTLNWSCVKGERAGYVQKLSEKGWICNTWEGEMASARVSRCAMRNTGGFRSPASEIRGTS